MSYTGTYRYNKTTGLVEKISSTIPDTQVFDVFVPEGGYQSENLGCFVDSRKHKRQLLKDKGLRETNDKLSKKEW